MKRLSMTLAAAAFALAAEIRQFGAHNVDQLFQVSLARVVFLGRGYDLGRTAQEASVKRRHLKTLERL